MTPLCKLALKYGTDKCAKHNYTPVYYSLFKKREHKIRKVMEIGIKTGASLRMWEEYFPRAKIFGLDRKQRYLIHSGRISSFQANQDNLAGLAEIARSVGGQLDLIVDDGSHLPSHQISSMETLMPFLERHGVYVIEDVNDESIIEKIPPRYAHQKIRTNKHYTDSVLVIVRPR